MRYLPLVLVLLPAAMEMSTMQACYAYEYPKNDPVQEKCLATMIYGEARGEALLGKVAVAFSAINRAKNKTICEVVLAPKQYSIFNGNPTLRAAALSLKIEPVQKNSIDADSWAQSKRIAALVLQGLITDPTQGATHYIADRVMKLKGYRYPKWSRVYAQVAIIDNHRFFRYDRL